LLIFSNLCEIKFTKQSLHYFFEKVKICLQKYISIWNKVTILHLFSYKKITRQIRKFLVIFGEIFSKKAILFLTILDKRIKILNIPQRVKFYLQIEFLQDDECRTSS